MPAPPGLTAKEKRKYMAKQFEVTQHAMSSTVDELSLMRRTAVPYPSTWQGASVAEHGPIPTDAHLIPSNMVITKPELPSFKVAASAESSKLGGKPWASFELSQPIVFVEPSAAVADDAAAEKPKPKMDEEMWRAQYLEWTLQKNAYNPDIAASMRTNVRKQASLTMVDPGAAVDPARSSENVKAALTHSDDNPMAPPQPKTKLTLANVLPMC